MRDLRPPPKLTPGDRVAVLSPSFAAPAVCRAVPEQPCGGCGTASAWSRSSTPPPAARTPPRRTGNTNLLTWRWNLGLASWHGGDLDLQAAAAFSEDELDWASPPR